MADLHAAMRNPPCGVGGVDTLRKHDVNLQALTDKQIVDRAEMIDDLLSDRPWWRRSKKAVKFMGISRDDWASMASSHPELVAHFGLAAAVERAHAKMQYDLFHNMERRGRQLRSDRCTRYT